jgi:prolyl-tRNA synthetase
MYESLVTAGIDVLLDDRNARPGVKFADADLLGIPHRLTLGDRGLKAGAIEYRARRTGNEENIELNDVVKFLQTKVLAGAN